MIFLVTKCMLLRFILHTKIKKLNLHQRENYILFFLRGTCFFFKLPCIDLYCYLIIISHLNRFNIIFLCHYNSDTFAFLHAANNRQVTLNTVDDYAIRIIFRPLFSYLIVGARHCGHTCRSSLRARCFTFTA